MTGRQLADEHLRDWNQWLDTRPERVREVAASLPPWHLYRVVSTGQHATILSYDEGEDGTVTLSVEAWHPLIGIPHGVFGMRPDDLAVEEPFAVYDGDSIEE